MTGSAVKSPLSKPWTTSANSAAIAGFLADGAFQVDGEEGAVVLEELQADVAVVVDVALADLHEASAGREQAQGRTRVSPEAELRTTSTPRPR
ncbi:hypothetical protein Srubr_18140 [Streptomyces rubradiris]|uniref:Uncharacterized protein n=1 Tax=Streptomyces rubradiris TaxID=285531 RepID=A0ABQ3R7Z5_STRRR|nr:hypothetical protein [Streptomyces rubradiris]GHI51968.1 hypothetical protein Srubr_18140 [Streptomyces rubradiris]